MGLRQRFADANATLGVFAGKTIDDFGPSRSRVQHRNRKPRPFFISEGDHSFKVPKRSGIEQDDVFADSLREIRRFIG